MENAIIKEKGAKELKGKEKQDGAKELKGKEKQDGTKELKGNGKQDGAKELKGNGKQDGAKEFKGKEKQDGAKELKGNGKQDGAKELKGKEKQDGAKELKGNGKQDGTKELKGARKLWLDNLRWVTVLLVLFYHVIYFFNNKGVFGGIGGFGTYPEVKQYQDVVMYILYPWFMPLLFLLAGISARYALDKGESSKTAGSNGRGKARESAEAAVENGAVEEGKGRKADGKRSTAGRWFSARTRKLLVPATIGLLVFQWMVGYFNTAVAGVAQGTDLSAGVPGVAKYIMCAVSGIGPLWFIQDLWLFSLILLLIRKIDAKDRLYGWCGKLGGVWVILLGVLFWVGEQTLVFNPRPESLDGIWNLYNPVFYFIPFLLGYYIFSRDEVQEMLGKAWITLMAVAIVSGTLLVITTFGQDNTTPQYLASPLNCLYGWLMCLAVMGWFKAKFDKTNAFAGYMTRSSFGLYIVHYLVIASLGYMMYRYTQLPPVVMYLILSVAVFTLSPLLYELLRRIPVIRWCVLGERKQ